MFDKFKEIESNYDVENIRYRGEQVWSYLRTVYYWKSLENVTNEYANLRKENFITKLFKYIKQSFYGFSNWFQTYDYFVFAPTELRILNNNQYIDKSFEKIMEMLGYDNCLYIDQSNQEYIPIKKTPTLHIVSGRILTFSMALMTRISKLIFLRKKEIRILDEINKREKLKVDYPQIVIRFDIEKRIYKLFLNLYTPKVIFINCYYSNQSLVKAASELNIKVIEVQHGQIGENHFAYHLNKKLDNSFFPDILLTFSEYDKSMVERSQNNPFNKVVAVGRYALELIKAETIPQSLLEITKQYDKTVSISTQYTLESELAEFIKNIAKTNNNIGFLLSLRHFNKNYYDRFSMPSNVYLFKGEFSCYDILKVSDMHMTGYSTCAIEALFFKKKSILININNMAFKTMGNIKSENIYIIETEEEFQSIIKRDYVEEIDIIYANDYITNIRDFMYTNMNV